MADFNPKFVDLVRNYTVTSGTADFALGPAVNGYTGFASALQVGDRFYYACLGIDRPAEREVGRGTLLAGNKIQREPISGTKTSFGSGNKAIALIVAAEWHDQMSSSSAGAAVAALSASLDGKASNVATRAALAALPATAGTALLGEAGREGLFGWSAANLSALVTADIRQGIYVAPASDPSGASGAWVRKFQGRANLAWFGAVADWNGSAGTDNYAAFAGAIALSKAIWSGSRSGALSLFLPAAPNLYYCAQRLTIAHPLAWVFDNGFCMGGTGAGIKFPAGQGGLMLDYDSTTGGAAGFSLVRPHLFGGFAGTEGEFHGIEYRAKGDIVWAKIDGFEGDGITNDTHGTGFNVNDSSISGFVIRCRVGVRNHGEDSNNQDFNVKVNSCRRRGLYSRYSLGNQWRADASTNGALGVGGAIPFTMCSYAGNRYYVLPNQNGAATTTAPSGTSADNAVWGYRGPGGPATEFPAWVSGALTFRSGGAACFEGSYEQNHAYIYVENDQAPVFCDPASQGVYFSSLSGFVRNFDNSRFGGQLLGTGAGLTASRSVQIGDVGNVAPFSPNASTALMVQGNAYLTRATGNAFDPTLFINSTNAYANIEYQLNGTSLAKTYYGLGRLTFQVLSPATGFDFYATGGQLAAIDAGGFDLKAGAYKVGGTAVISSAGLLQASAHPALAGDVTSVAGSLTTTIASGAVTLGKMANMASGSLLYRKSAGAGAPEVQTLATLKADLNTSGFNGGDDWAMTMSADATVYVPAAQAITVDVGNAAIGTGTVAYQKSTAAAPATFASCTLPTSLEAGAWLQIAVSGVSGFKAVHLRRTA